MVKKTAIFFTYTFFFLLALMYFAPKSSVYFFLEEKLKQADVVISSEQLEDRGLTLGIANANLSFKSISSAKIDKATINIFAVYNSLSLNGVTLSSTAKAFVPLNIENAKIVYSIFNPLNAKINAVGEFGELTGEFNVVDNSLHLKVNPSKEMIENYQSSLKKLGKTENGEFIYDKTF